MVVKLKSICLVFFLCVLGNEKIEAQIIDIASGFERPGLFDIKGNYAYVPEYFGEKISKIDITGINQTPTDVITDVRNPRAVRILGDDLYFVADQGNNSPDGRLFKMDLTSQTPVAVEIVAGLSRPNGLVFHGDYLYITQTAGNKLSKINYKDPNPVVEDVVRFGSFSPIDIIVDPSDNSFYVTLEDVFATTSKSGKVSKVDISGTAPVVTDLIDGLNSPSGLEIRGNTLYFGDIRASKFLKVNLTDAVPEANLVEWVNVRGMRFGSANDGNIYMTELQNSFSKLNLSVLSTDDVIGKSDITLYPNPSQEFISLNGLTETENYRIYNVLGVEVNSGFINNNEKIIVRNLTNGLYFLKFESGSTIKFIKK